VVADKLLRQIRIQHATFDTVAKNAASLPSMILGVEAVACSRLDKEGSHANAWVSGWFVVARRVAGTRAESCERQGDKPVTNVSFRDKLLLSFEGDRIRGRGGR